MASSCPAPDESSSSSSSLSSPLRVEKHDDGDDDDDESQDRVDRNGNESRTPTPPPPSPPPSMGPSPLPHSMAAAAGAPCNPTAVVMVVPPLPPSPSASPPSQLLVVTTRSSPSPPTNLFVAAEDVLPRAPVHGLQQPLLLDTEATGVTSPAPIAATSEAVYPLSAISKPPPPYGSKDYWEQRYQRQFQSLQSATANFPVASVSANDFGKEDDHEVDEPVVETTAADEDTSPYHAWYFTYEDLRPLILPILLGGRQEARDIIAAAAASDSSEEESEMEAELLDENEMETEDEGDGGNALVGAGEPIQAERIDVSDVGDTDLISKEDDSSFSEEMNDPEAIEDVEMVEDDDDEPDEDDQVEREGLANKGPVSVLEIGCGDVPLGAGLALDLKALESSTPGTRARTIVKEIVCTDYSDTVIQKMKEQYQNSPPLLSPSSTSPSIVDNMASATKLSSDSTSTKVRVDVGDVPLHFAVADARHLPYPNNSFELILEKGTLDAMLSDQLEGTQSCIQILSECARVLTAGGYIMLISHLNAHTPKGLAWLEDVVFQGLKNSCSAGAVWEIEVHGNDVVLEVGSEGIPAGSPGPAVYILHRKPNDHNHNAAAALSAASNGQSTISPRPTIPVKFFSY